jgi:predicted nucleic acid-binding protein
MLNPELAEWLRRQADALYLSAVTIAEIEQGICKLRRTGGTERADRLTVWLNELLITSPERILPLDGRVGREAGILSDRAFAIGRHPGFADIAIAATASTYDLVLLSQNGRYFAPLGIPVIDPAADLPTA